MGVILIIRKSFFSLGLLPISFLSYLMRHLIKNLAFNTHPQESFYKVQMCFDPQKVNSRIITRKG